MVKRYRDSRGRFLKTPKIIRTGLTTGGVERANNMFVSFKVHISSYDKVTDTGEIKETHEGSRTFYHGFIFRNKITKERALRELEEDGQLRKALLDALPEHVEFLDIEEVKFNQGGMHGRIEGLQSKSKKGYPSGFPYLKPRGWIE